MRTALAVMAGHAVILLIYMLLLGSFFSMQVVSEGESVADMNDTDPLVPWLMTMAVFLLAVLVGGAVCGSIARQQRALACCILGVLAAMHPLQFTLEHSGATALLVFVSSAILCIPIAVFGGRAWARLRPNVNG